MCCLKYEENAYEDLVKKAPKVDAFVETPSGKGTVTSVNLLRGNAKVRLEDGYDTTLKTFPFEELDVLGGKARRAEYITAKAEGKLEEAGFTERPRPQQSDVKPEFKGDLRPGLRKDQPPEAGRRAEYAQRPEQKPFRQSAPVKQGPKTEKKPFPPRSRRFPSSSSRRNSSRLSSSACSKPPVQQQRTQQPAQASQPPDAGGCSRQPP